MKKNESDAATGVIGRLGLIVAIIVIVVGIRKYAMLPPVEGTVVLVIGWLVTCALMFWGNK